MFFHEWRHMTKCGTLVSGDFVYLDFSDTTGLAFVGTAATTSCDNGTLVCTVLIINAADAADVFFDHSTPGTNLGMAQRTASTTAPFQSCWCARVCFAALPSMYASCM